MAINTRQWCSQAYKTVLLWLWLVRQIRLNEGTITTQQSAANFITTEIALAAYLHSEGFNLIDVDESQFPTKFTFENSSSKLQECVSLWERTKAEGNLYHFYRSYKAMIARIKDGNSGNRRQRGR